MIENAVIEIKDAHFSYDGEKVLEDVSMQVSSKDFACIVGPNGGGKTTLLKLILGLVHPQSGQVKTFNQPPETARSKIGYMPQNSTLDPFFPITAIEVVLTGLIDSRNFFGGFNKTERVKALSILEEVGLADLYTRSFARLSGGQKQRVLIARALVSSPELLLLDEPTASLDQRAEKDFYDLLGTLNERLTIVLVSHDLTLVSSKVKNVVCVNRKVVVHPTSRIPKEMSGDFIDQGMRMILHDQHCEPGDDH